MSVESQAKSKKQIQEAELAWRIDRVWEAHLEAWREFFTQETGKPPTRIPQLHPKDIGKPIRAGLLLHDRELLGPDQREDWQERSWVRAAGIGIFRDPWCTGKHRDNDAAAGGQRYLQHWRPWKPQRGKADPIPRFADLYFNPPEPRRPGAPRPGDSEYRRRVRQGYNPRQQLPESEVFVNEFAPSRRKSEATETKEPDGPRGE